VFADPVVVLAKQETPLLLFFFNRELIEILRKIEPFAGFVIMAFYELLTGPVGLLAFDLLSPVQSGPTLTRIRTLSENHSPKLPRGNQAYGTAIAKGHQRR